MADEKGPPPAKRPRRRSARAPKEVSEALSEKAGELALPQLITWLAGMTDEPRMEKTVKMLKADKFQLYSEIGEDELVGVVRSQTGKPIFYACTMRADGTFSCIDSELVSECRGINGYPCKHLMVLMVGLAQAKRLSPNTVRAWVKKCSALAKLSRVRDDAGKTALTFLKYQAAQSGEVDWRPTETIPEDYSAL